MDGVSVCLSCSWYVELSYGFADEGDGSEEGFSGGRVRVGRFVDEAEAVFALCLRVSNDWGFRRVLDVRCGGEFL